MTEGEEALVGKWVEFLGERTLPFNPPSWALGSSWPEALAQEYKIFCIILSIPPAAPATAGASRYSLCLDQALLPRVSKGSGGGQESPRDPVGLGAVQPAHPWASTPSSLSRAPSARSGAPALTIFSLASGGPWPLQ